MAKATRKRLLPDLRGVEVHVLGADNAGKSMSYWAALRDFWSQYFREAGTNLRAYSHCGSHQIPRTAGWLAQWQEMLNNTEQKIAGPRQVWTGHEVREFVPLEKLAAVAAPHSHRTHGSPPS